MSDIQLPANLKNLQHYCDCYVDQVYESHGYKCARLWSYLADHATYCRVADGEYERLAALQGTSARLRIGVRFTKDKDDKPVTKWWVLEVL